MAWVASEMKRASEFGAPIDNAPDSVFMFLVSCLIVWLCFDVCFTLALPPIILAPLKKFPYSAKRWRNNGASIPVRFASEEKGSRFLGAWVFALNRHPCDGASFWLWIRADAWIGNCCEFSSDELICFHDLVSCVVESNFPARIYAP